MLKSGLVRRSVPCPKQHSTLRAAAFLSLLTPCCGICCSTTQAPPPPALINADLICRAPDNVLLLLGLLRQEPEGCEDFYVRYGALQVLSGLMRACPDKLQVCAW